MAMEMSGFDEELLQNLKVCLLTNSERVLMLKH